MVSKDSFQHLVSPLPVCTCHPHIREWGLFSLCVNPSCTCDCSDQQNMAEAAFWKLWAWALGELEVSASFLMEYRLLRLSFLESSHADVTNHVKENQVTPIMRSSWAPSQSHHGAMWVRPLDFRPNYAPRWLKPQLKWQGVETTT